MREYIDEQQLLTALKGGSKVAFTTLYRLHWQKLFIYVMKVVRDEDETADIIQDVFLNLWLMRDKFDHIHTINSYLFIMARNTSLQRLASKQKNSDLVERLRIYSDVDCEEGAEKIFLGKELKEIIDHAINKLPAKMKEVFVLSRNEDLSHREIAERLHISDKTVKKQVSYAIKIIKACLKTKLHLFIFYFIYVYFL